MSFVGGKLKLKGTSDLSGVKKKKSKKKGNAAIELAEKAAAAETEPTTATAIKDGEATGEEGSAAGAVEEDRRTDAEKRFEAHMMKYEEQRLKKAATKSHRERVKEMNEKLSTLTEHHDLPRISYSYM